MAFDTLLGNQQLKQNLTASLKNGRISHFYLICGPEGSGKKTLARLLAAAAMCREPDKPCLRCSACRKVMENTHPDVITVQDPEHKTVAVKLVRQFREDVFIRPNEGAHKVYLFPQELGIEGQNALLKILEEPPSYGIFLLLCENPEKLLPTVRSRCVELKLRCLPETVLKEALTREFPQAQPETVAAAITRSGGFLGQAKKLLLEGSDILPQTQAFAEGFSGGDTLVLLQTLSGMEKWKRDPLLECLNQWLRLLTESLTCRAGLPAANPLAQRIGTGRSSADIRKAVEILRKAVQYAQSNVSPGAICGWLLWELR